MASESGLAEAFHRAVRPAASVEFTAYDGSRAGATDPAVRVHIRSREAVRYLVTSPGELGLSRAYISGALEVQGDLYTALAAISVHQTGPPPLRDRLQVLRALGGLGALVPLAPPPEEVRRLPGRRHSKRRDSQAIAHHYDVSNRFYRWVLGPSMAYTCAVFPHPEASLEEAQAAKFDLVCRKLGLRPGMRLLDVGCGWGGLVVHAAQHYGVVALGVTLSRRQAEWAQKLIAEAGLAGAAQVRQQDYRDVTESGFDAVASVGLTEHIGRAGLPAYFTVLRSRLRPGGRLLNHCITRPTTRRDGPAGHFISRYVFPDGELEAVGTIVSEMQDAGLEVRHAENLREHYALTLQRWSSNLDAHWDAAVAEVGVGRARVWRLYLAGTRLGFESDTVELHQVLGVRSDGGRSEMPLRPDW